MYWYLTALPQVQLPPQGLPCGSEVTLDLSANSTVLLCCRCSCCRMACLVAAVKLDLSAATPLLAYSLGLQVQLLLQGLPCGNEVTLDLSADSPLLEVKHPLHFSSLVR
jgi:hypothetical protein